MSSDKPDHVVLSRKELGTCRLTLVIYTGEYVRRIQLDEEVKFVRGQRSRSPRRYSKFRQSQLLPRTDSKQHMKDRESAERKMKQSYSE